MAHDAGHAMKTRMRSDLRIALKEGRTAEARLLRALVAALDNAEAPPLEADRETVDQRRFRQGSAEIERYRLSPAQVREVLLAEIGEREQAAAEMTRLARPKHADNLRSEALLARRYIE